MQHNHISFAPFKFQLVLESRQRPSRILNALLALISPAVLLQPHAPTPQRNNPKLQFVIWIDLACSCGLICILNEKKIAVAAGVVNMGSTKGTRKANKAMSHSKAQHHDASMDSENGQGQQHVCVWPTEQPLPSHTIDQPQPACTTSPQFAKSKQKLTEPAKQPTIKPVYHPSILPVYTLRQMKIWNISTAWLNMFPLFITRISVAHLNLCIIRPTLPNLDPIGYMEQSS